MRGEIIKRFGLGSPDVREWESGRIEARIGLRMMRFNRSCGESIKDRVAELRSTPGSPT